MMNPRVLLDRYPQVVGYEYGYEIDGSGKVSMFSTLTVACCKQGANCRRPRTMSTADFLASISDES